MMQLLRTLQPNLENPVGPQTRAMLAGLRRAPKKRGAASRKAFLMPMWLCSTGMSADTTTPRACRSGPRFADMACATRV